MRERVNTYTHLYGAVLSLIGTVFLILKGAQLSWMHILAAIVFGASLIALYSASSVYHGVTREAWLPFLRRLDHTMIYVLIAGTYTPICLITLKGTLGYTLLSIVWGLAIVGIIQKLVWFNAPRWLYTSFYLGLGWMAVFFLYPLSKSLPFAGMMLLIGGGLSYSIGAVIYAIKKPKTKFFGFGFHEIFHMFILLGSTCHYLLVLWFVIN